MAAGWITIACGSGFRGEDIINGPEGTQPQ